MHRLDCEGRTAVVTGGAAGIGLAVAKWLVLSGARAARWDLDATALATAAAGLGHGTHTQTLDVADAHAVERAAAATAMAFGRIDALVGSAGIAGPNRTTWQLPIDDRRRRSLRPADSGSRQPGANPIDARRTGGDRGDGQA